MFCVSRVYPDNMIIHVLTFLTEVVKTSSTIITHLKVNVLCIKPVYVFRIAKYFLVIIARS